MEKDQIFLSHKHVFPLNFVVKHPVFIWYT